MFMHLSCFSNYHIMCTVKEKTVDESTSEESRWKQCNLPYGYLWWAGEQDKGYAAMGDGGNIIYVSPARNMVVAIASVFLPRAKDRIEFIKNYVEPIFEKQESLFFVQG